MTSHLHGGSVCNTTVHRDCHRHNWGATWCCNGKRNATFLFFITFLLLLLGHFGVCSGRPDVLPSSSSSTTSRTTSPPSGNPYNGDSNSRHISWSVKGMDSAYYDADDGGGGGGGGRGGVGGDGGVEDAYPSPSSSLGRSPIPRDNDGGLEESSPRSSGPVFVHGTDDIHASDHDTKHNGEGESKRYPVASVEFARVETPFIIGVWIFCASLAKIGFHMTPKLSRMFPESCLLITVGVLIGVLLTQTGNMHVSPLTPDTFFLYMLPPIILDAGYFMPNRLFFDHLGTILLFAVIGTIFNTLTIGTSLWAVGQTGLFECETPILEMFLFSALISAVDPVAVLAVFEEIHVDEVLYIVVFGESLLNDAVTVVLYHMFEAYTEMGPNNIIYTDVLAGFASFFVVALGGTIIGILWGFLTGLVTRYTYQVRVIEPIFIFVMAYLAYLNAEIFHMSGILAITFCGITMKNYVEANISHKSHTTVKYAMKMLSSSSETIIFMFLGVATINSSHDLNLWFIVLTIAFCSVYRAIGVILLTAVANRFRLQQLNRVEKFVMSYGGLRGAVAFALVLLIDKDHIKLQPMFVSTTIAVIYFTVFFQGITIKPLVKILNVKRAEKRKPTMNERIHERFMDHLMAGIEDILGRHGNHHVRDKNDLQQGHIETFISSHVKDQLLTPYDLLDPISFIALKFIVSLSFVFIKLLKWQLNTKLMQQHAEKCRFKRFDNRFIRPYLLRNYQGAEPKILETYSKLAMKDAMEYMRRNASTIGNISGTESMSAIFRNYTAGNINGNLSGTLNGSTSFSQLDSSTWNIDMQELEYNPSKKDMTDARIHHLLAEELCKPYRRHRRLSYSRHAVDDRDLSTQPVNYRMHMNIRRMVGERKHHKRSKRLGKDGKQNHVSFPGITQNGSAKQFSHDYINEVLQESENDGDGTRAASKEDWDSAITFTAKASPDGTPEASVLTQIASLPGSNPRKARLIKQYSKPTIDYDDAPTVAEVSLPWRRGINGDETNGTGNNEASKKPRESDSSTGTNASGAADCARVTTPTATETVLPWKRDDEGESTCALKQSEFPAWCSNKEYLAYSSPSATFLGGIEQPKIASVIGLFRRESSGSAQDSRASSESSLHHASGPESPPAPGAVLLIEEGGPEPLAGMLGITRRPPVGRRGSMLELGSTTVNSIPEEEVTTPLTSPQNSPMSSMTDQRWMTLGKGSGSLSRLAGRLSALVSSSSSSSSSGESSNEDDGEETDEKYAISRTQN